MRILEKVKKKRKKEKRFIDFIIQRENFYGGDYEKNNEIEFHKSKF